MGPWSSARLGLAGAGAASARSALREQSVVRSKGRGCRAEQGRAADRAGILAFQASTPFPPARLLSLVVRREVTHDVLPEPDFR